MKIKCNKYRKIKNSKISYIFHKTLVTLIVIFCSSKDRKIFKEDEPIEILKIIVLINNMIIIDHIKNVYYTKWIYNNFKEKMWLKKT